MKRIEKHCSVGHILATVRWNVQVRFRFVLSVSKLSLIKHFIYSSILSSKFLGHLFVKLAPLSWPVKLDPLPVLVVHFVTELRTKTQIYLGFSLFSQLGMVCYLSIYFWWRKMKLMGSMVSAASPLAPLPRREFVVGPSETERCTRIKLKFNRELFLFFLLHLVKPLLCVCWSRSLIPWSCLRVFIFLFTAHIHTYTNEIIF